MLLRWDSYKKRNKFVENVTFEDTIKSIKSIIEIIYSKGNILSIINR